MSGCTVWLRRHLITIYERLRGAMGSSKALTTKEKRIRVFHPLMIGLYFPISYLANNYLQLNPVESLRTILFSLLLAGVLFGVALLLIKNKAKAGIIASAALFFFFTYGHVYRLLEDRSFFGHHRYLMGLWAVLFLLVIWFTLRTKRNLAVVSNFLNYFAIILLALSTVSIFRQALVSNTVAESNAPEIQPLQGSEGAHAAMPDVYYIILDTYAREDMLLKNQAFDNSDFIDGLRQRGFYVAECSLSNYNETVTSLSSSLNMDYLENFTGNLTENDSNFYKLGNYIKQSQVMNQFKELGYTIVTFETGYWWLDVSDSDLFVTQYPSSWYKITHLWYPSKYERDFLYTTSYLALDELLGSLHIRLGGEQLAPEHDHYDRMVMNFETLQNLAGEHSPKFVYAHLITPHFPYVFAPDGSFHYEKGDDPGYLNQVKFVNQRILTIVDALIQNSATPPIIVIQGDHGIDMAVRNAILNAYYFPGETKVALYPTITPLNTFRLIFNTYFDASYPLLPDIARSSTYQTPFQFEEFVDSCEMDGK